MLRSSLEILLAVALSPDGRYNAKNLLGTADMTMVGDDEIARARRLVDRRYLVDEFLNGNLLKPYRHFFKITPEGVECLKYESYL